MELSNYNNTFYKPGSPLKKLIWYFVNEIFFKSGLFPFYTLKSSFLKMFGANIGKGVLIKPNVNIKYPWLLEIGNYVWIGENVWIDNLAHVKIGSNVCISQGAFLLTGNHDYKKPTFDLIIKEIVIQDQVWIGAKAIVCPGIICETASVLSAGSVANKNLESNCIYQGNPAIKIKSRYI